MDFKAYFLLHSVPVLEPPADGIWVYHVHRRSSVSLADRSMAASPKLSPRQKGHSSFLARPVWFVGGRELWKGTRALILVTIFLEQQPRINKWATSQMLKVETEIIYVKNVNGITPSIQEKSIHNIHTNLSEPSCISLLQGIRRLFCLCTGVCFWHFSTFKG